jgi:hypothetical protein
MAEDDYVDGGGIAPYSDPLKDLPVQENPLISKIGQAYQVIGMACRKGELIPEEEWQRALDYFADEEKYDDDFLPWPRKEEL